MAAGFAALAAGLVTLAAGFATFDAALARGARGLAAGFAPALALAAAAFSLEEVEPLVGMAIGPTFETGRLAFDNQSWR